MRVNSINSNSFQGSVSRHLRTVSNGYAVPVSYKPETKEDFLKSYNDILLAVHKQKARAIELDEFMFSDKVQKEVEKLPEDVIIEMNCDANMDYIKRNEPWKGMYIQLHDTREMERRELYPNGAVNNRRVHELSQMRVQKKDGTINKEGIISWIKGLQEYFNQK